MKVRRWVGSRSLAAARWVWVVLALTYLVVFTAAFPAAYRANLTVCEADECGIQELSPEEISLLEEWGISHSAYAVTITAIESVNLVWVALGIMIFLRRSHDWIGLIVSMSLIAVGINGLSENVNLMAKQTPELAPFFDTLSAIAIATLLLLIFLMPDGRFVPEWTRYAAVPLVLLALADPVLVIFLPRLEVSPGSVASVPVLLSGIVAGVVGQIQRYRDHSTMEQRQQTKWIILGFVAVMIVALIWTVISVIYTVPTGPRRVIFIFVALPISAFLTLALPITMTFSILRYRLWDIDILINRALIYGTLTTALLGIYLVSVFLVQELLLLVTGQASQIAIVGSTLLSFALFSPLRNRIQAGIDSRFYRRKYDAEAALAHFSREARDEVELPLLRKRLIEIAADTMQPKHISLWLKEDS